MLVHVTYGLALNTVHFRHNSNKLKVYYAE